MSLSYLQGSGEKITNEKYDTEMLVWQKKMCMHMELYESEFLTNAQLI